jgi:hypothetical protein
MASAGDTPAFPTAYAVARDVPGWLTREQAEVLHAAAGPGARVVEIGTHLGRSAIVLAASGAQVTAIDPFDPHWRYGRGDTESACRANLAAAGVTVDLRVARSRDVRASWTEPLDLLYIDGKHDYWSVREDQRWTEHVRPGGTVLVHDAFGSLGVTLGLLAGPMLGRTLAYRGRTGSLARWEVASPTLRSRMALAAQLPWFVRNLGLKVLIRLRLRGGPDPY